MKIFFEGSCDIFGPERKEEASFEINV